VAESQRLALAVALQAALITDVRQKGAEAAATPKTRADTKNGVAREVLRREGDRWRIASGQAYTLVGNQGKPAKARLTMRTTNGPYGAPESIHEAQPLLSNDGADGCAGLCGKNG